MKSKQFESQNLVFLPEIWIQKYATTRQIVKKCPLSSTEPWELFGSRGAPRLRLADVLEERGAFAEAEPLWRRVLEATERRRGPEHRWTLIAVNNLAWVLYCLGKFSEAPLMCCAAVTVAGGWCCILCWEKLGKCRETTTRFSDHLRLCQVIHLCNCLSSLQGFLSVQYVLAFVSHTS